MRTYVLLGIGLLIGATMLTIEAQDQPKAKATPSAKIQALRNDQLDALKKAHESMRVLYEVGKTTYTEVAAVHKKLLEAQLQAATTREARLEALRGMLKNAQELEKLTETQFKEGLGMVSNYQLARAARLEIQIKIEQENE